MRRLLAIVATAAGIALIAAAPSAALANSSGSRDAVGDGVAVRDRVQLSVGQRDRLPHDVTVRLGNRLCEHVTDGNADADADADADASPNRNPSRSRSPCTTARAPR